VKHLKFDLIVLFEELQSKLLTLMVCSAEILKIAAKNNKTTIKVCGDIALQLAIN
jgi:hypothetical protein